MSLRLNIESYIQQWKDRCYDDLPDEIPQRLAELHKAPCYRSVALAILSNDNSLKSLGQVTKTPKCYHDIKKAELANRSSTRQLELF